MPQVFWGEILIQQTSQQRNILYSNYYGVRRRTTISHQGSSPGYFSVDFSNTPLTPLLWIPVPLQLQLEVQCIRIMMEHRLINHHGFSQPLNVLKRCCSAQMAVIQYTIRARHHQRWLAESSWWIGRANEPHMLGWVSLSMAILGKGVTRCVFSRRC
jgi:hypothetical protein